MKFREVATGVSFAPWDLIPRLRAFLTTAAISIVHVEAEGEILGSKIWMVAL
jgi:hypothetical protein